MHKALQCSVVVIASLADALLAYHAIFPPQQTPAEMMHALFSIC